MENIYFTIDHMDPLGQGVSKEGQISFIEKTLPGEKGTAEIYREAKGVRFGRLCGPDRLDVSSPDRVEPECPLYYQCRGCQYLHTDYSNEIRYKTQQLNRIFAPLLPRSVKIEVHRAEKRFGYRNRVQIHYDLRSEELGFISSYSDHLIDASRCLLPSEPVKDMLKELYADAKWKEYTGKTGKNRGYFELYIKPGTKTPLLSVNKPYAEGGFTQVNDSMGTVLSDLVTGLYGKYLDSSIKPIILDIFGGNGNLSKGCKNARIKVYDRYTQKEIRTMVFKENQQFINIDLYKNNPLNQLKDSLGGTESSKPDLIIFDPPRAGVKFIESYIKHFDTPYIFYVSCDPATLKRDTIKITDKYNIPEMHLIDLFPGTRHFETLIVFRKE